MRTISATKLRNDLYQTIRRVNGDCEPVLVTTSKGKSAVLIGEDDWAAIQETLYLSSVPGMVESLKAGMAEPLELALAAEDLDW